MTSEIIASPAHPEPGAAPQPARAQVIGRMPGPVSLRPSRPAGEPDDPTKLAAALAQERHVTLELQRAILPLHEGPFDLPGLRAVVRYCDGLRCGFEFLVVTDEQRATLRQLCVILSTAS